MQKKSRSEERLSGEAGWLNQANASYAFAT